MGSDTVHDKDLEKILKHYCNTPFFRDNPYYIRLWERYYVLCNRDPNILFFMKHKRISKNHHFMYIELSRHFELRSLKDVSAWILQRAIEAGVYRNDVLVSELIRLGRPPNALTKDEIARELNPQDFLLWGKKWCSKENIANCEKKPLEDSSPGSMTDTLKEMGIREGLSFTESRCTEDTQNAHVCTRAHMAVHRVLCPEKNKNADAKEQCAPHASERLNGKHEDYERSIVLSNKVNSKYRVEMVHVGAELTMENHVFYVKSEISRHRFLVIRISSNSLECQSTENPYYTLQEGGMNRALFDKFAPEKIESLGRVLLYKHYELGLLSSAVRLMPELNVFFFLKALELAMYYAEKNIFFADLSMDDFFIGDDMSLVLCTFSQKDKCCVWEYRVFSELAIVHANVYMDMQPEEAFREISAKLCTIDTEVLLLRLKIAIFERNIAECIKKHDSHLRVHT